MIRQLLIQKCNAPKKIDISVQKNDFNSENDIKITNQWVKNHCDETSRGGTAWCSNMSIDVSKKNL